MALYEFYCEGCKVQFEQITRLDEVGAGVCPKCASDKRTKRLISKFKVGGRGDLRETTVHGCHGYSGLDGDKGDGGESDGGGHNHGPGCGH